MSKVKIYRYPNTIYFDKAADKKPAELPPVSPARRRLIRQWAVCNALIQAGAVLIVSQWWPLLTVLAAGAIWLLADLVIVAWMQAREV